MLRTMQRTALVAAASIATIGFAAPASAAVQVNANGSVTVSGTSGGSAVINLNGSTENGVVPGLSSQLTLNFLGAVNGTYTFSYTLANTSSNPTTASRLNAFAFNTNPNITLNGATILNPNTALFDEIRYSTNMPNGIGDVELCFTTNNCAGGGSDGLSIGQSGSGSFTLNFGNVNLAELTLDNFAVRYQAVTGPGVMNGSATGRQITTAVPEPGTWALMLVGFGAVGFSMRRRRRQAGAILQMA
jgi:hypothetical protein